MYITADKDYDGVAYTLGNSIVISVDWMNSNPVGIGYFSHELTHAVQQYGNVSSSGPAWWVENMAKVDSVITIGQQKIMFKYIVQMIHHFRIGDMRHMAITNGSLPIWMQNIRQQKIQMEMLNLA